MKFNRFCLIITTVLFFILSACSTKNPSPGAYDVAEVGKLKKVVPGVIISMRPIYIYDKQKTPASGTDKPTTEDQLGTSVKRKRGFEYVVKLDNGDIASIAQDEDLHLSVKQRILVISGDNVRIVPDEGSDD